nr:eukaryotic translation initiation factor 3 subunit M-like [Ipomoea trifida]GME05357.1 eukaryotic translation initiation factor 3 subunit M-like [Ipomoea batatas]
METQIANLLWSLQFKLHCKDEVDIIGGYVTYSVIKDVLRIDYNEVEPWVVKVPDEGSKHQSSQGVENNLHALESSHYVDGQSST